MGKLEDIEAALEEANANLAVANEKLDAENLKLDEIKDFIESLEGGATEAELETLLQIATGVKDSSQSVTTKASDNLAEADALDEEE